MSSVAGFNACGINGCNSGVATLKKLGKKDFCRYRYSFKSKRVKRLQKHAFNLLPKHRSMGHPKNHFRSRVDKYSPDDLGDDTEVVLEKVQIVGLDSIERFHTRSALFGMSIEQVKIQRSGVNEGSV